MKTSTAAALLFLGIGAILILTSCLPTSGADGFDTGEIELVEDIDFEETCVGRHIVSLPVGWQNQTIQLSMNGLNVSRFGVGNTSQAESLFSMRRDALASGAVKDGAANVELKWHDHKDGAYVLAHSLEQAPGFPEMVRTIEGWVSHDGVVFKVEGIPATPFDTVDAVRAVLKSIRPHGGGVPPTAGSCFAGGYVAGPLRGTEMVIVTMNSDTSAESFLSLSLDLATHANGQAQYDAGRFGGMTREYTLSGLPGGERVAIIENALDRDSGMEFLASAGGNLNGAGVELRAELTKQDAHPNTPPFGKEEALTIWHTMLQFIRPWS